MVKVTKIGQEPFNELQCPRGCGNLRYGRTTQYLKKTHNCKKCKGHVLTLDEIKTIEKKGIKRFNKMRRNKLGEVLSSGTLGNLNCPKCSRKMVEIKLYYKRGRHMAKQEKAMLDPWKNSGFFVRGIPIIVEAFGMVLLATDVAGDLIHGKLDKTVTIDACPTCFIFWFDKTELVLVIMNDVTAKSEVERKD